MTLTVLTFAFYNMNAIFTLLTIVYAFDAFFGLMILK